ncbi:hypothetical protein TTHERM_00079920 (macronuclear) [Tetrahymena thermophila SB210]|uniref:Uncharacterized protein n=1 Tax=Tetrahymena thermophila (strain SB210) TaxID=312017 RepID=Q23FM3_TETTS|nr:hypothetical protein TTHERM_00079920 [Tetrahymena thermophila SB210]EAR95587.1 hypothetical protein TTHERM_00079920 [Tetrahymena thermophila SB210]|eukprot:XP_001015832.1 hypothetical protein TTHERM_00079920 [Tetrahymena thermophila SB210]
MNRQQDSKGKKTSYRQQQDYGQYEYSKQYKDDNKPKQDYEIYEKEDYSEYIQKNEQDKYYYEADEYEQQNQHENPQDQQEAEHFEEVPNIKKILAKKVQNDQKNKLIQSKSEQENNQNGEEGYDDEDQNDENYQQEEQEEEDDDEYQEDNDDQNKTNNQQKQQKQGNLTKATKKVFKKYEDQGGLSDEQEDEEQYYEEDEEEQNLNTNQYLKQQQNTGGILKNSKQNQNRIKTTSNKNIQDVDDDDGEEDDPEKETDYPEQSNQTQQSSKSGNSNNYLRSTKSFQTKQEIKQEEKTLSQMSEPFDNIYNTKKYPLGIVDDPALEEQRKNLWKTFGRECAAGRELFSLYKCHMPPKISYPKPKQKTAEELLPKPKEIKPCPQKTQISYPPLSYKEPKQKYFKVDFIPKRKPESEIRKELEEIARNPYIPANTGKNRKELIEKLQQKFKHLRGGLPKGAELPLIDENKLVCDEEAIKNQAKKRIGMKNKIFTGEYEDRNDQKTVISDDPVQECNILFDQIMQEIEERQEYLDSIKDLKEPKLKTKIKKEIIERVAELQKVTELKQKYM